MVAYIIVYSKNVYRNRPWVATSAATSNIIIAGVMWHRPQSRWCMLQQQYKRLRWICILHNISSYIAMELAVRQLPNMCMFIICWHLQGWERRCWMEKLWKIRPGRKTAWRMEEGGEETLNSKFTSLEDASATVQNVCARPPAMPAVTQDNKSWGHVCTVYTFTLTYILTWLTYRWLYFWSIN